MNTYLHFDHGPWDGGTLLVCQPFPCPQKLYVFPKTNLKLNGIPTTAPALQLMTTTPTPHTDGPYLTASACSDQNGIHFFLEYLPDLDHSP